MADLEALTHTLAQAVAAQDVDAMREARSEIVAQYPSSEAAAEARYKLAMDLLFVGRDLPQSVAMLEQAIRCAHPFWVSCARTSLALCYLQQKRVQKALFELRRVGYSKTVNAHSVTALMFMETVFTQEAKLDEADKVRRDRQGQLQQLLAGEGEARLSDAERGHYLHQLALTHGPKNERSKSRAALEEALALGPQALGQDLWQALQHTAAQENNFR